MTRFATHLNSQGCVLWSPKLEHKPLCLPGLPWLTKLGWTPFTASSSLPAKTQPTLVAPKPISFPPANPFNSLPLTTKDHLFLRARSSLSASSPWPNIFLGNVFSPGSSPLRWNPCTHLLSRLIPSSMKPMHPFSPQETSCPQATSSPWPFSPWGIVFSLAPFHLEGTSFLDPIFSSVNRLFPELAFSLPIVHLQGHIFSLTCLLLKDPSFP